MMLTKCKSNGVDIAVLRDADPPVSNDREAVDLLMAVKHEQGCENLAISKEAISPSFFILSTGLAGEILQKFVNYRVRLAIYGDFSGYTSKPLQDFIRESNRGDSVFFLSDEQAAVERLSAPRGMNG